MGDLEIKGVGGLYHIAGDISDAQYGRMIDGTVSVFDLDLAASIVAAKQTAAAEILARAVNEKYDLQTSSFGGWLRTRKEDISDFFAILSE